MQSAPPATRMGTSTRSDEARLSTGDVVVSFGWSVSVCNTVGRFDGIAVGTGVILTDGGLVEGAIV